MATKPAGRRPFARFSRYICTANVGNVDICWVSRRYNPTDLRHTAPVPRFKLAGLANVHAPVPPSHWVAEVEAPLRSFSRAPEERPGGYTSSPSTRSEEWSTLREMLPSRGWSLPKKPPRWGLGGTDPPIRTDLKQRRFPHTNSAMTK